MDRLSRRQLIGIAAGSSAALAIAGTAVLAQTPAAAPDFEQAARDSHRQNSAVLAGFEIPMSLEPAFQFKA